MDPGPTAADEMTELNGPGEARLEQALRRRLERMREPKVFHPIRPEPEIETAYPERESTEDLETSDVERRSERKRSLDRDLHKRIDKRMRGKDVGPTGGTGQNQDGDAFSRTEDAEAELPEKEDRSSPESSPPESGDSIAARARKRARRKPCE